MSEYGQIQYHAQNITGEIARLQQEADRLSRLAQLRDAELLDLRRKVHAVATVKCWTNEDGKRFVFADDLAVALGVRTEVTA